MRYEEAVAALADDPAPVDDAYARSDELIGEGRADEAALEMVRFLARVPDDPIAAFRLGDWLLVAGGRRRDAEEFYRRAAAASPHAADEWLCKGLALLRLGRLEAAGAALRRAFGVPAPSPHAGHHLALLLIWQDQLAEAVAVARTVVEGGGEGIEGYLPLALALRLQGDAAEADEWMRRLIDRAAIDVPLLFAHAQMLHAYGVADWSAACCARALDAEERLDIRLFGDLLVPQVAWDEADTDRWRARYADNVATLTDSQLRIADPLLDVTMFHWVFLFFQARPARDLSAATVRMYKAVSPDLAWTAPHCANSRLRHDRSRLRIGCLSHSSNPFIAGLLAEVDRERFEVVHLQAPEPPSPELTKWAAAVDRVVPVPEANLTDARAIVAAEEIDILVTAPWSRFYYFLSFSRLARVQCSLSDPNWADAVPASDYYVSWKPAEPADLATHYSSAIALMDTPPYWFPADLCTAAALTRGDFELPAEMRWYVCPHMTAKLGPAYDHLIAEVLRSDPGGCVVVLRGDADAAPMIRSRMRGALGELADRLFFLPTLPPARAQGLLQIADVVLDSWPIQGLISTITAFQLGVPLVTLTADQPFGRWTAALYDAIGVSGLTTTNEADFVRLAHRMATDRAWHRQKSEEILGRAPALFENRAAVRELEHFWCAAADAADGGQRPRDWRSGEFVDRAIASPVEAHR